MIFKGSFIYEVFMQGVSLKFKIRTGILIFYNGKYKKNIDLFFSLDIVLK